MPDFGDEMGQAVLNVAIDALRSIARRSTNPAPAGGKYVVGDRAYSDRAEAMEKIDEAWDQLDVDHDFVAGDPDNAKLVFSPVADAPSPDEGKGISQEITKEIEAEKIASGADAPTRPLDGPEGPEPDGRTEELPGKTVKLDDPAAGKTARMDAQSAPGEDPAKSDAKEGVPTLADDPRAAAEREQALGSLGPASKGLSFEEQSAQCRAYAEAVQKELSEQGVDSVVRQEEHGAWALEVAKCDVGRAADIARALRAEFPGEYAHLRDFELQGAVMVPGLDEQTASLVADEATKLGMRASISRAEDGTRQVTLVGGSAEDAKRALEAAGVRVGNGERLPLSMTAEEAKRDVRAKGAGVKSAPDGATKKSGRARSAKTPSEEHKAIRTRPKAPAPAAKPIKTPSIGAR